MLRPATANLEALIRALLDAEVSFIVVGGAAAVIHGAPINTRDLDIVPRLLGDDAPRLVAALTALDARFRPILPGRDIAPTVEHVLARGQLNLTTRLGPLDVLGRLHDGRGFDELEAHAIEVVDGDLRIHVIDLATLIEIKRSTGRVRDHLAVPILEALRKQTERDDDDAT